MDKHTKSESTSRGIDWRESFGPSDYPNGFVTSSQLGDNSIYGETNHLQPPRRKITQESNKTTQVSHKSSSLDDAWSGPKPFNILEKVFSDEPSWTRPLKPVEHKSEKLKGTQFESERTIEFNPTKQGKSELSRNGNDKIFESPAEGESFRKDKSERDPSGLDNDNDNNNDNKNGAGDRANFPRKEQIEYAYSGSSTTTVSKSTDKEFQIEFLLTLDQQIELLNSILDLVRQFRLENNYPVAGILIECLLKYFPGASSWKIFLEELVNSRVDFWFTTWSTGSIDGKANQLTLLGRTLIQLVEEIAIIGYFLYKETYNLVYLDCGRKSLDLLLHSTEDLVNKRRLLNNFYFYVSDPPIDLTVRRVFLTNHFPKPSKMFPAGLSISYSNRTSSYLVICRFVNYAQEGGTKFVSQDTDGRIRMSNYAAYFDANLTKMISPVMEIVTRTSKSSKNNTNNDDSIVGLDSIRPIERKGKWWFTCNSSYQNKPCSLLGYLGSFPSSSMLESNGDSSGSSPRTTVNKSEPNEWKSVIIGRIKQSGKNTLLIRSEEESTDYGLIGNLNPLELNSLDWDQLKTERQGIKKEIVEVPHRNLIKYDHLSSLSHLKLTTNPISFKWNQQSGYLALAYQICTYKDKKHYFHRWIWFNSNWQLNGISLPFYFDHKGIEVANNLIRVNSGIGISLGLEDREALIQIVNPNTVLQQLHRISRLPNP